MLAHYYYYLHFAYHLKGEAKHIGGRQLSTPRQRPIAPPRSPRTAEEGMPISSGIMRRHRALGRELSVLGRSEAYSLPAPLRSIPLLYVSGSWADTITSQSRSTFARILSSSLKTVSRPASGWIRTITGRQVCASSRGPPRRKKTESRSSSGSTNSASGFTLKRSDSLKPVPADWVYPSILTTPSIGSFVGVCSMLSSKGRGRDTPKDNPDPGRLGSCMAYRGGAIGYPRSSGRGSAGGSEAQVAAERRKGSVSASFAGRKEERDRDRSSEGEAVV